MKRIAKTLVTAMLVVGLSGGFAATAAAAESASATPLTFAWG